MQRLPCIWRMARKFRTDSNRAPYDLLPALGRGDSCTPGKREQFLVTRRAAVTNRLSSGVLAAVLGATRALQPR
jgi:hypothetical protein